MVEADRWRRIEELFHAALQEPVARRRDYVAIACRADDDLGHEVLSLLDAHETSGNLLDEATPFAADTRSPGYDEFRGTARFALQERLGEGAFGVVYRAVDSQSGATVALKVLREARGEAIYHFKREFRSLADIVHPNLVSLFELLSDGRVWFFTMELVDGTSFVDDARRCASPADRARATLRQLVQGLMALHRAGQLHRDIKPANVLVTPEGTTKILDFGLVQDSRVSLTSSGWRIAGTPTYMSPEALRGLPSAASDWYSVGALLYETLTGRPPFSGTVAEIVEAKTAKDAPSPSPEVPGEVPPDLAHLCRALLSADPVARPSGSEILRALSDPAAPVSVSEDAPAASASPALFVGREREIELLFEAFAAAATRAVIVPIGGHSGIGKTRLVSHFIGLLGTRHDNVVTLSGRCFEHESIPYKAVDNLLDELSSYLRSLPFGDAEKLLPPDLMPLTRLFPVLHQVPAVMAARRPVDDETDATALRRRGFAALRTLLSRMAARSRVVFLLDDLQWGDADSAALLSHVLAPPDAPPFLVIGCYRSEDLESSEFLKAMTQLVREAQDARPIDLAPLTREESRTLASSFLPEGEGAAALEIADQSAGSPIFVELMVRHSGEVPLRGVMVEDVIRKQVHQLPDAARRLLETIAVGGQPIAARAAQVAVGLDTDSGRLLTRLKSEHLVRTTGMPGRLAVEVYHDRIRAAVQDSMTPADIARRRGDLAGALETTGTGTPELLSLLFERSGDAPRAALHAIVSAEAAARALAFDQAARFYRLALELEPGSLRLDELRRRLADALIHAGRGAEAATALLEVASHATAEESLDLRRSAADQLLRAGLVDEGLALFEEVMQSVGLRLARTPRIAGLRYAADSAWLTLRGFRFRERSAADVSRRDLLRIDTSGSVSEALSLVDNVRAAAFAVRTVRLALLAGEPSRVARSLAVLGAFWGFRGGKRTRRGAEALQTALDLAERLGDPRLRATTLFANAAAAYGQGSFQECADLCRLSRLEYRDSGSSGWEVSSAEILLFSALVYVGRWAEIQAGLPALLHDARERGDRFLMTHALTRQLCFARLMDDDPRGALEAVDEGVSSWTQKGFHLQHYWGLVGRTEVALYEGDGRRAWALVQDQIPKLRRSLLHRSAILGTEVLWLWGRAGLAAAADEGRPALDAVSSAAKDLQRSPAPGAEPCGLSLKAGLLMLERRFDAASKTLETAARLFEASGMNGYAAVTRRRLGVALAGDEGSRIAAASADYLRSQGVVAADHMTRLYHPGPPSPPRA